MIDKHQSSLGYNFFSRNYSKIEENICDDKLLDINLKQSFFNFISSYSGLEEKSVFEKECCNNFFYKNQFLGTINYFDCKFGHVATSENLKITKRKSIIPLRSSKAFSREKSFIDFNEFISGVLKIEDIKRKFTDTFRPYTIWIFKDPDNTPFKNNKYLNKDMRALLGLGHLSDDVDLYGLTINLQNTIKLYLPTAFDAEFSVFWKPGGYTIVLKDIYNFKEQSNGLQEFITHGYLISWDIFDNEVIRLN